MSNYENKGVIFKNNYKEKETQPDYKGKINVDGKEKEIALWVAEDKNGSKYFQAKIQEVWDKDQKKEVSKQNVNKLAEATDSDLPF